MNAKSLFLSLFLIVPMLVSAGTPQDSSKLPITGNFALDVFGMRDLSPVPRAVQDETAPVSAATKKSPWLAGGLSLVLPGAGEFYTQSYWKSAGFFAAEIALWALAYYYDHRGDKQTDYFQDYANAHWSVLRYVQQAIKNFKPVDPNTGQPFALGQFWSGTPDPQHPWVGANWSTINRMETVIAGYYSHNLAPYGDQQYFEMIGKYEQFNMGWDDVNPSLDPSYPVQAANSSPESIFYMGERARANKFYDNATTFVTIAIVNHILSAVDAALSATWYNKAHASMGVRTIPTGTGYTTVPVLNLSFDI